MVDNNEIRAGQKAVRETSQNIDDKIALLETFIARRFDEISMEINATSQQVDMAEEGITKRFTDIMEVIQAISFSGGGTTPANAGVELDAVVDMTENAANTILDAATRITETIGSNETWDDKAVRLKTCEAIQADVDEIFMACSFQDITSQRIRKTLDNLKQIEERLSGVLDKLGIKLDASTNTHLKREVASSQDDIDALFGDEN